MVLCLCLLNILARSAEVEGHNMVTRSSGRIGLYSVVFVMYHALIQTTWRNGIHATYTKQMTTNENARNMAHATMDFCLFVVVIVLGWSLSFCFDLF